MKKLTAVIGFVATSITAASAANYITDTVGTINGNGRTILEATGNSLTSTTFISDVATAFANNTGGVWNFDGSFFSVDVGETITLNYGTLLSEGIVLTLGGTNGILQSFDNPTTEPTSGQTMLGLSGNASTRTFTPSSPLLTIGYISTDRGASSRFPSLTVTFQDTTTASTSGANADDYYFHGISGTVANPIVSFSITQNAFVRYDDLGFIVVPEPGTAGLAALGLFLFLAPRRRV